MINLNQLRVFYEAAKHLNFSAAANTLCISQPAVTVQVKLFEEALALKLFRKSRGKLQLTEAGQAIFERAGQLFAVEKEIEPLIGGFKKGRRGELRIGTARTYEFLSTGCVDITDDSREDMTGGNGRVGV